MLEPKRTARVIGILVLLQGAVFLSFWKLASWALAIGIQRYSSFTGKMAKAFFSSDHSLLELMLKGTSYLSILFAIGITASVCGILIIAFPKLAVQVLVALRVLKRA